MARLGVSAVTLNQEVGYIVVNGSSSGFSMPKQLRNKDIDDYDLPKEEVDLSVITVERARGACCEAKTIWWAAFHFTRIQNGHPTHI